MNSLNIFFFFLKKKNRSKNENEKLLYCIINCERNGNKITNKFVCIYIYTKSIKKIILKKYWIYY